MAGWIKLHRKVTRWGWYDDANTFRLFMHLLLMANHKDGDWHGIEIKRGQFVTGRKVLAKALKLSERSVRTSLTRLKTTNELTIKTTNRFSIITIVNYNAYNDKNLENDQQNDQPTANKRPTNDQQTTTNKNVKKGKKEKALPVYEDKSDAMLLAVQLYKHMLRKNEKTKRPDLNKWAHEMALLLEDGECTTVIHKVIEYSQDPTYYRSSNIRSASKFRELYSVIWENANKPDSRRPEDLTVL